MPYKYGQTMQYVGKKGPSVFQILTPDGEVDYEQPITKMEMFNEVHTMTQTLRLKLEDGRTVVLTVGGTVVHEANFL